MPLSFDKTIQENFWFAAHIHILHEIETFSFLNNSLAIVNDKVYSISRTFELESTKIDLINSLKFFNMTRTCGPRTFTSVIKYNFALLELFLDKCIGGLFITYLQTKFGQGNAFTGVCLSMAGGGVGFPACITGHMTSMGEGRWLPSIHYRSHDKWGGGSASGAVCLQGRGSVSRGRAVCLQWGRWSASRGVLPTGEGESTSRGFGQTPLCFETLI